MSLNPQNRLVCSLLTAVFLFMPISGFSAELCQDLLWQYGQLRSDFVHSPEYVVEVKSQSDIKNQCTLGTCHLHAWTSILEQDLALENMKNVKISTHYLSAMHWINKSLKALSDKSIPLNIQLGETVSMSRQAIQAYGLIPDEAWTGSRTFAEATNAGRINEYLKNTIARVKWALDQEVDSERKKQIIKTGEIEIKNILKNLIGEIPKTFEFRGKTYNPISFSKEYFPTLHDPLIQIFTNNHSSEPTKISEGVNTTYVFTNLIEIEKIARQLLDQGKSIYFSYEHNGQFVDKTSGIMSISAFDVPKYGQPLPRNLRTYFGNKSGGHAVQIVGYDIDEKTNQVTKWKIKNSWGEKAGDHGYYHMYADYFRTYANGITFFKDEKIQLPKAEAFDPIQLQLDFSQKPTP